MTQFFLRWFAAAMLVVAGCEMTDSGVDPERCLLVGSFFSYQTPSEVADLLRQRKMMWSVIEESALPESDPRPRFAVVRWQVDSFMEGSLSGEAQFLFFNERLVEVVVFPEDPFTLPSEQEAQKSTPKYVRVRIARDFREKLYIAYTDSRLRKEMDAWLSKYS